MLSQKSFEERLILLIVAIAVLASVAAGWFACLFWHA